MKFNWNSATASFAMVVLLFHMAVAGCAKSAKSNSADDNKSPGGKPASKTESASIGDDVKAEPIPLKDFPKPNGTKVALTTADTRTIMIRGPVALDAYLKFYETKLHGLGWKKDENESFKDDGTGFLRFEKGNLQIEITVNPDSNGKTMAIIAQGSGVSVPPEKSD